ncbi:MAG TPA: phosphoribosylaminoimidazolesuccinocarboxamide synthase [Myxococcales bacterium]|jgi:phosphoribosylaminoimidazole-succinocarboxamide synthase|nr:phosphoribosylaminoimidazolesuccinocarboxamide synthase [Myxococcales bacterium]
MDRDQILRAQLPFTLREADFPGLGTLYRGKVRDNFSRGDRIAMVTTDRISAFDRVLTTIPFKGEMLNRITAFWFERTRHVAQNHLLDVPDPSVLVVRKLRPLPVEVVVRGYITGSLWRDHEAGRGARAYGLTLPAGLRKDEKLEKPILTPSTKEAVGTHDQPISPAELVARGAVTQRLWDEIADRALALFQVGQEWARTRGLILVDTKYEFGLDNESRLWLIDEIHTPDSSRYWIADGSEERFRRGEDQRMLDKEFFRQWLIRERSWQGDGPPPEIPDEVRARIAGRYCDLVEQVTGEAPALRVGDTRARIEAALRQRGYL